MKATRYLAAACAASAALGMGTASATAPAAPGPDLPRAVRATAAHGVLLADADNGRTLTVHTGDVIEVRLTGERTGGTTYTWSAPAAGGTAVLRRTTAGVTPAGGTTGRFVAAGRGIATLTARRTCHASPGSLCAHHVLLWKATVTVA
ncbi:hypothetical protein [Streptomyces noursei]|uniref:hypothetical protein n=1 Tax=Streptomyces noursei TaxID=1971 RepID=UPI001676B801|nr:hypothetical protein [Streptomyces noursei]MCZ1013801.1 hypothetical protein [Streptomyces noursei]GGX33378.1 hypothetical protein GCM10010341_63500 [Streptomyces noursei]